MICEKCGKRTATTHVKTIVNGKLTEHHFCAECAGSTMGLYFDFGSLLSGLFGGTTETKERRCEHCGASFSEIAKTGKLGCQHCYEAFRSQLTPVIQKIHGSAHHIGKRPGSSALRVVPEGGPLQKVEQNPLEEKKRELQKAIEEQAFERAAVLRDEIKEMEANG